MTARVDVTVRSIAAGGSGVGDLPDGRVVFVPRTVPGDRVRIRIDKSKARWAVGSIRELVEAGPGRRDPLCPLYSQCGGCHLQHLPYERQLEWKGRFVADALGRIGGFESVQPPEVVPSPAETGYRNRMTFTLRRLRSGHVVAGLHALGRPAHVIDVATECVLPTRKLIETWAALRGSWGAGARLLPRGGRLRLTLREADPAGVELVVEGGEPGWDAAPLARAVEALSAVRHTPTDSQDGPLLLWGSPGSGRGTSFTQVNPRAAELLHAHVLETASEGQSAVDAYCGFGAYGRALAGLGWRVTGVETDPSALDHAKREPVDGLTFLHGRVEDRLADLLPVDLLIVNPPRSGLHGDVPGVIAAQPPKRLVYVSCDSATLARDLRGVSEVLELVGVRSFDLFPQTAHVETVAVLARREGAA